MLELTIEDLEQQGLLTPAQAMRLEAWSLSETDEPPPPELELALKWALFLMVPWEEMTLH